MGTFQTILILRNELYLKWLIFWRVDPLLGNGSASRYEPKNSAARGEYSNIGEVVLCASRAIATRCNHRRTVWRGVFYAVRAEATQGADYVLCRYFDSCKPVNSFLELQVKNASQRGLKTLDTNRGRYTVGSHCQATFKSSINQITNPTRVCSHAHTRDNIFRAIYMYKLWTRDMSGTFEIHTIQKQV
jgi:hypothetical protein